MNDTNRFRRVICTRESPRRRWIEPAQAPHPGCGGPAHHRKSFYETSMRRNQRSCWFGKSTLYDYFPSKDDILIAYVLRMKSTTSHPGRGNYGPKIERTEKSRGSCSAAGVHGRQQAPVMKLSFESSRLSFDSQQRIQQTGTPTRICCAVWSRQAYKMGEFRPVNPLLALRGMFGLHVISCLYFTPDRLPQGD